MLPEVSAAIRSLYGCTILRSQTIEFGAFVRYVSGRDWKWYNQDGGVGGVGVVVEVEVGVDRKWVTVRWMQSGEVSQYRWGAQGGKYDVEVVSSGSPPPSSSAAYIPSPASALASSPTSASSSSVDEVEESVLDCSPSSADVASVVVPSSTEQEPTAVSSAASTAADNKDEASDPVVSVSAPPDESEYGESECESGVSQIGARTTSVQQQQQQQQSMSEAGDERESAVSVVEDGEDTVGEEEEDDMSRDVSEAEAEGSDPRTGEEGLEAIATVVAARVRPVEVRSASESESALESPVASLQSDALPPDALRTDHVPSTQTRAPDDGDAVAATGTPTGTGTGGVVDGSSGIRVGDHVTRGECSFVSVYILCGTLGTCVCIYIPKI